MKSWSSHIDSVTLNYRTTVFMNTVLDLYMDIFNDVVVFAVAKVTKCFEKILFEVIILFLVFQKGNYHPN